MVQGKILYEKNSCVKINRDRSEKEMYRKMKATLGLIVFVLFHLSLLNCVHSQTSHIEVGDFNHPVIYNRTIGFPPPDRPWYQRFFGFITRPPPLVQNVTYTFPPNSVSQMDLNFKSISFNFAIR